MEAEIQFMYIPRSGDTEPRMRLAVFRETGSALLDRQIAETPPGDVLYVNHEMLGLLESKELA